MRRGLERIHELSRAHQGAFGTFACSGVAKQPGDRLQKIVARSSAVFCRLVQLTGSLGLQAHESPRVSECASACVS